jgi:hypothetical protein
MRHHHPIASRSAHRSKPIASRAATRFSTVELRIHSIDCLKTTGELDQDEIELAAIKVEHTVQGLGNKRQLAAKAESGGLISAGKFKNGEVRRFEPARVATRFTAGAPEAGWPRIYEAILLMIELDEGAAGKIVAAAVQSVEKQARAAITKAATAAAGAELTALGTGAAAGAAAGSAVPLIGTAIGTAVGAAAGLAMAEIKRAHEDDVFEPVEIQLSLPSFPPAPGEVAGSRRTARLHGFKGTYVVHYSWAIV